MASDLDRRFVARLRLAGLLVLIGLAIQIATMFKAHPATFLAFLIAGTGLVVAGAVAFVWAWFRQNPGASRIPDTDP